MRLVAICTIGKGKTKKLPGDIYDEPDMGTARMLIDLKVAEPADDADDADAAALIANGIDSVDVLQTADASKLSKIKGITKAVAAQIIESAIKEFE
jgi:hypothetical protein